MDESVTLDGVATELRAPRAAGVAGIAFATLFVTSLLLLRRHPEPGASADAIAAWYLDEDSRNLALVGLYLVPFAGIAFLWFIAVVRSHVADREDRFFATVFLGSGLLFVAMLFAAAAASAAPVAAARFQDAPAPSADAVGLARSLAYTLLFVYGVRAAAVFVIVSSTIGLRTGTMPRWLALLGYAAALILLFSVSFLQAIMLIFPAWVTVVSVVILVGPLAGGRGAGPVARRPGAR
jgi:hypothetical protein